MIFLKHDESPVEIVLVGGWPTHLKNISQLGWLFPIYGKKMFQIDVRCLIMENYGRFIMLYGI